jgi:hypothetical protein
MGVQDVLGHDVVAPSTLRTFLRSFTFDMSASSTGTSPKRSSGPGRRAPAPANTMVREHADEVEAGRATAVAR